MIFIRYFVCNLRHLCRCIHNVMFSEIVSYAQTNTTVS